MVRGGGEDVKGTVGTVEGELRAGIEETEVMVLVAVRVIIMQCEIWWKVYVTTEESHALKVPGNGSSSVEADLHTMNIGTNQVNDTDTGSTARQNT